MSMFDLSGKVAVVTGSSRGIGKAIAMQMALQGARVVISSRKAESCEAVVAEISAVGGTAIAHAAHVGHKEELKGLVAATIARWGRIDVLVCNAAANPHFGPSISITDEALEKVMHTNLYSNIWLCNLTLPGMAERKDGVVIIISSVAGFSGTNLRRLRHLQGGRHAAGAQSRGGMGAAQHPSQLHRTGRHPHALRQGVVGRPAARGGTGARYPLRRLGEPDDVAGIAVMLASRAGNFITGQTLVVDGGGLIGGGEPLM